jgi:hypothetical protein
MKFTEENQRDTQKITPPQTHEIEVDASTLTVLAVAALLIPLLIVGFFR